MNIQNKYTSLGKSILSGALCAGVLTASMGSQANTQQEVSQVPLGLSEGVPPNMLLTLDDSGSMRFSFTPDGIGSGNEDRKGKSSTYNAAYYNPNTSYTIPPFFNASGVEVTLDTSFSSALNNGFQTSVGSVDLSKEYQVAWDIPVNKAPSDYSYDSYTTYTGTGIIYRLARNPSADFDTSSWTNITKNSKNSTVESTNSKNIVFKITRTSSSSCTATAKIPGFAQEFTADCTRYKDDRYTYDNHFVASLSTRAVPAYYYIYDGSLKGNCTIDSEDCYKLQFVKNSEQQNFANWYSFYRNRALSTLSAASVAFYGLSPDVRLSWQALTNCASFNSSASGCGVNKFRPYSTIHKGGLYNWFATMKFDGGTPLRAAMDRAGKFLKTGTAWQKYLNDDGDNTAENKYACRPSYHVLMTDGMWNGADGTPTDTFKHDNADFSLPDTKSYTPKRPYKSSVDNTLADIAMHYWATDLSADKPAVPAVPAIPSKWPWQPGVPGVPEVPAVVGLANQVPVYIPYKNTDKVAEYWDPRNNPATWQHMSNFIVGLSLSKALTHNNLPWGGTTHAGVGYQNLLSNTDWPSTIEDGDSKNVYDLWHAAINSRGEFYSVDTPDAMVQAFIDILTRIADRKDSAAMPGVSTSLESDGAEEDAADRLASYFYQTTFDSGDGWAGDIQKVKKYRKYNEDTKEFEDVVEQGWSAKSRMPSADSRNIMIAGGGASKLKAFSTTNAGDPDAVGSLASYLNVNPEPGTQVATWQQRLEYVRGSKANEGEGAGKLRQRSSILGDFLTSQPVIVSGGRYLEGFANRLEGNEAYTAFMQKVEGTSEPAVAGRRGQLYIGGNDGMLHAFDTKTGEEKFAFIPTAVFPKLNKLTGKNYSHEFYVDGTPVVADVYDGSKWRTILVGTLRAGGKGLFALDITNPDDIQLLWEFGENSIADEDAVKPGYSFPQPTVARMHNGEWAVVTGNGYKGEGTNNGAAALYIINAITGEMIKSLEVQSPIENGGENGLSSPRLADYDSDGIADYAYAGDLHGNLWRFDLLGTGASAPTVTPPSNGNYGAKSGGTDGFVVSNAGSPMFTATSTVGAKRQSITSAPNLVRHPTRKGYLVMFGTGKYFEIGDKTGEESFAQTLYGIWDMNTKAETATAKIITRGELAVQTITSETTGTGKESGKAREARIISNNPVQWYEDNDSSKEVVNRGWRLDLTAGGFTGEMIVENMRTLGSMLLLQTLVPNDDPCANGSTTWLYAINPATGGATLHHAFDTRTADQEIVSGIKFGSEGGVSISQNEKGFTANAPGDTEAISPPADSMGRQTWRMVPDA